MGKQSQAFLGGESEAWLERNKDKLPINNDPVMETLKSLNIKPKNILEIGCSDGWRLRLLDEKYDCLVMGVEPNQELELSGWIYNRTADNLIGFQTAGFDLVIYGFCLYLCDREDLFKIVSEGDRILVDDGYLVVYDFSTPNPHKRPYKHREGLFSYKMDYAKLWLANPTYTLYRRAVFGSGNDATSVTILRKQVDKGWPLYE